MFLVQSDGRPICLCYFKHQSVRIHVLPLVLDSSQQLLGDSSFPERWQDRDGDDPRGMTALPAEDGRISDRESVLFGYDCKEVFAGKKLSENLSLVSPAVEGTPFDPLDVIQVGQLSPFSRSQPLNRSETIYLCRRPKVVRQCPN